MTIVVLVTGIAGKKIVVTKIGICGDSDSGSGPNRFRLTGGGLDFSWEAGQSAVGTQLITLGTHHVPAHKHRHHPSTCACYIYTHICIHKYICTKTYNMSRYSEYMYYSHVLCSFCFCSFCFCFVFVRFVFCQVPRIGCPHHLQVPTHGLTTLCHTR